MPTPSTTRRYKARGSSTPIDAFCRAQRARIRGLLAATHQRYVKRLKDVEVPMELEQRGLKQAWHRDAVDLQRGLD